MAEADPTQEKLKKYEKAVKKLKAAHEKATTELTEQKMTFESALAEKAALVESLKAAAGGIKRRRRWWWRRSARENRGAGRKNQRSRRKRKKR